MQSNAKALALVRDLKDRLDIRLKGGAGLNQSREAFDSNNWPYLVISSGGNEAAGQPVILIRVSNVDAVSKDIFGNQTFAYAPHICELAYELNATARPIPASADLIKCEFESMSMGARYQLKELANGTAVTAANASAASPAADIDPLYWPTKSV